MKPVLLSLLVVFSITVSAQTSSYYSSNGKALKGYDPVSYFLDKKAVAGDDRFSWQWSGNTWLFSSAAHLDSFKMAPERYAPQFGGYCAYGVSENHKSPTDPQAWTIIGDKLYLNYNLKVQGMWLKDTANRIPLAYKLWPSLN